MPLRFHVDPPLHEGADLSLPPGAARHAQVLRLQPGMAITLFDGGGGEWSASILRMGRSEVSVRVGAQLAVDRELALQVTLAVGMPANERMDTLIEKATELGAAAIRPLVCERSVLRVSGERAERKAAHWRAVAAAACEQCGRNRLPEIAAAMRLPAALAALPAEAADARVLLSPRTTRALPGAVPNAVICLSGPEGGLTDAEERAALERGFVAASLGVRVLRADTAPLAVLAHLALRPAAGG